MGPASGQHRQPPIPPPRTYPAPATPVADVPPSTVSPAIERFMKQTGQDLPPPVPVAPTMRTAPASASPSMPAQSASAVGAPAGQELEDVLRKLHLETQNARAGEDLEALSARPSPLATDMHLKSAPFDAADFRFPINLATAWSRRCPTAGRRVGPGYRLGRRGRSHAGQGALASRYQLRCRLSAARRRRPRLQQGRLDGPKHQLSLRRCLLTGSSLPPRLSSNPCEARQVLNSRHFDVQSAKNDALLQTADAYFLVHQHRGRYAGSLYCVECGRDLLERVATLSRDLVPRLEVERARNMLADLEQRAVSARQQWRVQPDLTQILRLDPRAVVDPLEQDHLQITLIDPARPLESLMTVAIENRPEIAARRACHQGGRGRHPPREGRMLLPTVYLTGYKKLPAACCCKGGFSRLGPNSSLNQWAGPTMSVVSSCGNLKASASATCRGSRASGASNRRRSPTSSGRRTWSRPMSTDRCRACSRPRRGFNRPIVRSAHGIITFNGQLEGLGQIKRFANTLILINRPQEAVYALQQLNRAFGDYFQHGG